MSEPANLEADLVARAILGDQQAFEQLYKAHARRLYAAAVYFLGSQDSDAEDMLQEAFARAWKNLASFRQESSFYTWVNQILVHLCYRRLEQRKRTLAQEAEALEALSASAAKARIGQDAEAAQKDERLALLRRCIEAMEEPCRSLVQGRDLAGRSYAELAQQFKVPMGTIMSRLARCRQELKRKVLRGAQP
jgi:RNA polymerase sigma-70 factor (ECF subfamily)